MSPLPAPAVPPSAPRISEMASVYVEAARRRLARDPMDPDAMFTLAAWHAVLGQPVEALTLLHRLTERRPDYPGVWRLKAYVFRMMHDDAMARRCEGAALRYDGRER